jgi:hypothetical protein
MSEPERPLETKRPYLLHLISAHPLGTVIAFVGALASIVALLLGFFPWWTAPKRNLTFCVNPVRTPIVQTSKPSDVAVSYKGKAVSANVTAVQIAIWNAGRTPIRAEDVLIPCALNTGTNRIMEASILRVAREVCEFHCDSNHLGEGTIGVKWRILEKGDGALIQLVYEGTPESPITVSGTIISQASPHDVANRAFVGAQVGQFLKIGVATYVVLVCTTVITRVHKVMKSNADSRILRAICIVLVNTALMGVFLAVFALGGATASRMGRTPFGF